MGKPTICICENKDADQLRGNREADQRLCFRYSDSTIPLLFKSEISSFYLFSVTVRVSLCRTCSETTLLVFPRGGSFLFSRTPISVVPVPRRGSVPSDLSPSPFIRHHPQPMPTTSILSSQLSEVHEFLFNGTAHI